METILKKIELDSKYNPYFKNAIINSAIFIKEKDLLELEINLESTLPYEVYFIFKNRLKTYLKTDVKLMILTNKNGLDHFNTMKYFDYFINKHQVISLMDTQIIDEENQLIVLCQNQKHIDNSKEPLQKLNEFFHQVGIKRKIVTKIIKETKPVELKQPPRQTSKEPNLQKQNFIKSKFEDYPIIPLKSLVDEAINIAVEGLIFLTDIREFRNGNGFGIQYYIHDGEGAILVNTTTNNYEDILSKGTFVRFYGDYKFDSRNFINDYTFTFKRYEIIEPLFERYDTHSQKRVEFNIHTKVSEMDGVSDITDYLDQAFKWNHPGLVISDHEGVQSFPKAYHHLKKLKRRYPDQNFKIGYGVEMNLTQKDLLIVSNSKNQIIESSSYVVFDLETTGLSAYYDYIIEFGAVKIEDGQVVDTMQMFIKPPISIPKHIENITQITDADVLNAKPIDKSIDLILNFIKDSILVAHNANFDINFLQEALRKLDRPPIENTFIDTLNLSRSLFEDRRSYRLGNVARLLKITYDDDVAHRADYDAEILASVFLYMKRLEAVRNLKTLDRLNELGVNKGISKAFNSHVSVIAKNQAGLKSLYELISLSYTKYLALLNDASKSVEILAEPRIIKDEINKRRDNFLIGAGCLHSDIFEDAMNASEAQLLKTMSFYDFVEIMPLEIYNPLIERVVVPSQERLILVIKRIIEAANKLNIPIVASGDVHYNHPYEKAIRDIYIHAPGIGGSRHPLYIYNETQRLNTQSPNQHYRTTDEMLEDFSYLGSDLAHEFVITNPLKLFEKIEEVVPVKQRLYTPTLEDSDEMLTKVVFDNAYEIYGKPLPNIVFDRLNFELKSILGHGFGVIYYISHLLVKKSMDDGYLVGSRGSVGSSLVATMAKITEVNPLAPHYVCLTCHHNEFFETGEVSSGFDLKPKLCPNCQTEMHREGQDIPFETFLGFEGDKVPDIDLNFSGVYQDKAHAYTKELFGDAYVYRAGTISTVAQKTAFGYVQGYYESISQSLDSRPWKTYLASGAEGVKRTTGQHPGGIIVIPNSMDVHDFTPVQYPANNPESKWLTTHFEFHDIDENVLKLDILGHVDPTAMKMLERISGIDINSVPVNDPLTISLFASPEALNVDTRTYHEQTGALGIPEFGTPFVRKMLEATKPDSFSDLVRISGLSHGTDVWRNNAEELIRSGLTLKDVIGCRDDIMVYLMQHGLQPKLSFDIMESVRRGRGLKDDWIKEMNQKEIPSWYIDSCQKIKYMFPKSHAVAYVMMAMRVAWFKVHHPIAYYVVYYTLRVNAYEIETMVAPLDQVQKRLQNIQSRLQSYETKRDVTSKEVALIDTLEVTIELLSRGYTISPIDLDLSHATEFIIDPRNEKAILPPFVVIAGLGESVAKSIVRARNEQPFISKHDLTSRSSLSSTLLKKMDDLKITSHLQESNQMSLFDAF